MRLLDPQYLANYPLDKWAGVVKPIKYIQVRKVKTGEDVERETCGPYTYDAELSADIGRALRSVGVYLGGTTVKDKPQAPLP